MDETLFGAELEHAWCYFYEKAELGRQQLDWQQVVRLYNQAQQEGLEPSVPVENLVFIEAFAHTGKVDTALKLTERTLKQQENLCPAIYTLWDRFAGTAQSLDISHVYERMAQNGCKR
jgi:hypothetical protein